MHMRIAVQMYIEVHVCVYMNACANSYIHIGSERERETHTHTHTRHIDLCGVSEA